MTTKKKPRSSKKGQNPKDKLGLKKLPLRLIPPAFYIQVSAALNLGGLVKGYGPYNWRDQPISYNVYLEAIMRHLLLAMDGEDEDVESFSKHEAHIAACCAIIFDAKMTGNLIDDRYKTGKLPGVMKEVQSAIGKQSEHYGKKK